MLSVAVLVTWMAAVVAMTSAESAGIKAVLTSSGLQFVNDQIGRSLSEMISGYIIPPQFSHGSYFKVNLDNMQIMQTSNLLSRTRFLEGQGVECTVSTATLSMTAAFRGIITWWFPIMESGTLSATLSSLEVTGRFHVARNSDGRPKLNFLTCTAKMGNLTVQVHGDQAPWFKTLPALLQNVLRDFVEQVVCSLIRKELTQNADRELAKLPTSIRLFNDYTVDLSLAATPTVQTDSLETVHKGVVSHAGGMPASLPSSPTLPPWQVSGSMLQVAVSQASLVSLLTALHSNRDLVYQLSSSHPNGAITEFLKIGNTWTNIGTLLHGLGQRFPGKMTSVLIASERVPELTMRPEEIHLQGVATVTLTLDPPSSQEPLLMFRLEFQARLSMAIDNLKLLVKIKGVDGLKVSVMQSSIGTFPNEDIQVLMNLLVQNYLIPDFNQHNRGEVLLPVPNDLVLVNPRLNLTQGAIQVATDLRFQGQ